MAQRIRTAALVAVVVAVLAAAVVATVSVRSGGPQTFEQTCTSRGGEFSMDGRIQTCDYSK